MKRNTLQKLICIALLIFIFKPKFVYADDYYSHHATGWHWYDDPTPKAKVTPKKTDDPNSVVSNARQEITTALNTAIANPTVSNLKHYIVLQNQMSDRASKFSDAWKQALLEDPSLDYSISHPTSSVGVQVYRQQESDKKDDVVKKFASQTGLFFFYRSTCAYCHRFAPILKRFAETNGVTVIPITMDGIPLPEFPNSRTDSGQAAMFHVNVTPSLFAVNPYTHKAYPVAYGLVSETEIRDAIYRIMTQYGGGKA